MWVHFICQGRFNFQYEFTKGLNSGPFMETRLIRIEKSFRAWYILLMNLFRTRFNKTENVSIFMVCKTIFHAFWTRFMMIWKPQDLVDFMSWMKTPRGFAPPPPPPPRSFSVLKGLQNWSWRKWDPDVSHPTWFAENGDSSRSQWRNIWTTRASVSPGYPNTRKQCMKTRARSASVFIHCFRVLFSSFHTMNRDVTECFRLLIWIEFLTKHNVIRNSIQVILHA
jgi:hypothetical protein